MLCPCFLQMKGGCHIKNCFPLLVSYYSTSGKTFTVSYRIHVILNRNINIASQNKISVHGVCYSVLRNGLISCMQRLSEYLSSKNPPPSRFVILSNKMMRIFLF